MTKKNFEKAAKIVQQLSKSKTAKLLVEDCFVALFHDDNPRFDEERFRAACQREIVI